MKKIFLVLTAFVGVALFTSSCKKCTTCSYTYRLPGTTSDSTITYAEQCGNKADNKNYENSVKADASNNGGTVTCKD